MPRDNTVKSSHPARPVANNDATERLLKKAAMDPKKQRSVFLILLGIPLMAVSSYGLYKRCKYRSCFNFRITDSNNKM